MSASKDPRRPPKDRKPRSEDIYIAVMGASGAGKSTFIAHCTESKVEVGHGLGGEGCTRVVSIYPVDLDENTTVWLVDTPGFDDTCRRHAEVLREIATWLCDAYTDNIKLHGIIYLHPTNVPDGGIAFQSFVTLAAFCGNHESVLKNVTVAITMWEDETEQSKKAEERFMEKLDLYGWMTDKGPTVLRYQNTRAFALTLIRRFVRKPNREGTIILPFQLEMVSRSYSLDQTDAGRKLDRILVATQKVSEIYVPIRQKELEEAHASDDTASIWALWKCMKIERERMETVPQQREDLKVTLKGLFEAKTEKLEAAHAAQLAEMGSIRNGRESQHEATAQVIQQDFEEMQIWSQYLGEKRPSPDVMEQGPVSLSLFGDRYWFDAPRFDYGNPTADIPKRRYPFPSTNDNYLVAWGEHNSWYIRYRVSCPGTHAHHAISSDNFQELYPGAHRFLFAERPNEDPTCVSLATNGHYFVATAANNVSHNLPRSVLLRLGAKPDCYQSIWLGKGDSYVSQRLVGPSGRSRNRDASQCVQGYHLGTGYPELEYAIAVEEKNIKVLALNPLDSKQYAILWSDGSARYSPGQAGFNASAFRMWCTNNFGTYWESSDATVGEPMKIDVDILTGDVLEISTMEEEAGPIKHIPPPWNLKGTSYMFMFWIPSSQARSLPSNVAFSPLESQSAFARSSESGSPQGGLGTIQIHRYSSSPAGPYDEFVLSTGMYTYPVEENGKREEKRNMRISRIYVSQKTACWNGRKDWNTPKHMARFEFNELSGGATEIKIFAHDTAGDMSEAVADEKPFFQTTYRPVRYMPSFPLSTSLIKLAGIDLTLVQPPVPEGSAVHGELIGSDRWCKFYPSISSSQAEAGWFDMQQDESSKEETFWPGLGRWRLGIRMKNAEIAFKNMEHWEPLKSTL